FRFRFKPGLGFRYFPGVGEQPLYSSGNNVYIDNIRFTPYPASVGTLPTGNSDIAVVPNPTSGDAYVVIKDAGNTVANIVVTDITGKVVYTASSKIPGKESRIAIPHTAISV